MSSPLGECTGSRFTAYGKLIEKAAVGFCTLHSPSPSPRHIHIVHRSSLIMSNDSFSTYALRPRHEHTYTASTLDASDVDPALGPTTSTTDDIYGINSRNALVPNGNWHPEENLDQAQSEYRLYKRRFSGLAAIVRLFSSCLFCIPIYLTRSMCPKLRYCSTS